MTLPEIVRRIREEHPCCVTTSAKENRCALRLADLRSDSLAIINGSRYQSNHCFGGKLADRIIFSENYGGFVCVVDLKGRSWKVRDTIEQVRNGFRVAAELLKGVRMNSWYPLVLSDRGPKQIDERRIQSDLIAFQGDQLRLRHFHCNSELAQIVRP